MIIPTTGPITVHCYRDGEVGEGHEATATISPPMPDFSGGYIGCSISMKDASIVRELARILLIAADRMEEKPEQIP